MQLTLSTSQNPGLIDEKAISTPIAQAADFVELCELFGYYAEEHIVQTKDGYLLGLHRLGWRKGEEDQRVNSGEGSLQKKVAYLHHGLMMNSEVWVCLTEKERCLPFTLVEQGYDVWVCRTTLSSRPRPKLIMCNSSVTTVATSTRRRASTTHPRPLHFGTTPSMSLLFMTFPIALTTSCLPLTSPPYHTLDSPRERLRHSPHFRSTPI